MNKSIKSFDKQSRMLYAIPNNLIEGDYEVGWNKRLSEMDKQFIKQIYPKVMKIDLAKYWEK
ncbi:hypothetical protein AAYR27_11350 [Bacillus safensis]|uniref:hypothetical protein n=1 Tax=Bacillus TaxID=1386 RepID=UPI0011AA0C7A|nr:MULTISPECIES: hypothetical protein [Bacillus]MCM2984387.1 hypothetical protein [Bacillus safensis]MCY7448428.1 hypothetical protein [Bacillus safensis]MCY7458033.1 hypothetical protein [Bacillus safensis]MDP4565283.1 hypothetical protein [Bacillus safensis]MEC0922660.1 hypothetical protein [Bacillus safensis]